MLLIPSITFIALEIDLINFVSFILLYVILIPLPLKNLSLYSSEMINIAVII